MSVSSPLGSAAGAAGVAAGSAASAGATGMVSGIGIAMLAAARDTASCIARSASSVVIPPGSAVCAGGGKVGAGRLAEAGV
eukprot:508190-Prorocentrum_minimum.AAC.1